MDPNEQIEALRIRDFLVELCADLDPKFWEKGIADFEKPELLTLALDEPDWRRLQEIFADLRLSEMACGGNVWEAKGLRARLSDRLARARGGGRP